MAVTDILNTLTSEELDAIRAMHKAGIRTPTNMLTAIKASTLNVCDHAEQHFYIPETGKPVVLTAVQRILLPIIAGEHTYPNLLPFYHTVYWTTPKKMAKTATSGAYARHKAEKNILNDEILFFANDETQSRGRAYAAIQLSIELNPLFDKQKRVLVDEHGNAIWRIIEDYIEHIPTQTKIRAVNVDYRGEAGANPGLSVWTEVWGYDSDKQEKLFDEMTDVLTKVNSQRYLEGYAGYVGKSKIQQKVERLLTEEGRQLTANDIPDWPWPEEHSGLPCYVNDKAGMFGFIDRGEAGRKRWPWTQGPEAEAYYKRQAITLSPEQYDRLHLNQWVTPVTAFIPLEWWRMCGDPNMPAIQPWREPVRILTVPNVGDKIQMGVDVTGQPILVDAMTEYIDPSNWRIVGPATPVVLGVDASVTNDCTAVVGCSRHQEKHNDVVLRFAYKWTPPKGGKMDYDYTPNTQTELSLRQQLIDLCCRYNVVELGYDNWQLHLMMTELRRDAIVWAREFSQSKERDVADKQLYDIIVAKRITYNPDDPNICHSDIEKHIQGASRTIRPKEDTRLHIVKSADESKIDLVVALSMASAETLRLDL